MIALLRCSCIEFNLLVIIRRILRFVIDIRGLSGIVRFRYADINALIGVSYATLMKVVTV